MKKVAYAFITIGGMMCWYCIIEPISIRLYIASWAIAMLGILLLCVTGCGLYNPAPDIQVCGGLNSYGSYASTMKPAGSVCTTWHSK